MFKNKAGKERRGGNHGNETSSSGPGAAILSVRELLEGLEGGRNGGFGGANVEDIELLSRDVLRTEVCCCCTVPPRDGDEAPWVVALEPPPGSPTAGC